MQLTGFLRDIFFVPLDYFPWNHLISCQLVLEHTYRVFNCQVVDFILYRECLNPWELASERSLGFTFPCVQRSINPLVLTQH